MSDFTFFMFAVGAMILVMTVMVSNGKTDLVRDKRMPKPKDEKAYARDITKPMYITAAGPLLSGVISLFGGSGMVTNIAVAVLIVLVLVGMVGIVRVQKKYDK